MQDVKEEIEFESPNEQGSSFQIKQDFCSNGVKSNGNILNEAKEKKRTTFNLGTSEEPEIVKPQESVVLKHRHTSGVLEPVDDMREPHKAEILEPRSTLVNGEVYSRREGNYAERTFRKGAKRKVSTFQTKPSSYPDHNGSLRHPSHVILHTNTEGSQSKQFHTYVPSQTEAIDENDDDEGGFFPSYRHEEDYIERPTYNPSIYTMSIDRRRDFTHYRYRQNSLDNGYDDNYRDRYGDVSPSISRRYLTPGRLGLPTGNVMHPNDAWLV